VALLVLATLYIGGHWVSIATFNLMNSDTKIGVLTARQETLNESIMVRALRLIAVRDDATMRHELGQMIDEFETGHLHILQGAGDPAMEPVRSDRLRLIFFEETNGVAPLNETVRKFIQEARIVQSANLESSKELLARIDTMLALEMSQRLVAVTKTFELDAADRVEDFHMLQVMILAAGLLTILVEFCLIFWPGHLIAKDALTRLEEKSAQLSASNERLQDSLLEAQAARFEADQSNRAKSMFLANMSHELRTPLNAIIGFSSLIRSETFGKIENDRYIEYSADIERSGQHLLELIGDLMDISQVEVGAAQLERRFIAIADVINQVKPLAMGWPMARQRNIEFDVSQAPDNFYGDSLRLRQIILNLLSNAIKFTREGDGITVTAKGQGDGGLMLIVEDTGRGFDPDSIDKLLQPFERGDDAFTRKREGTGLGLSLVVAFAEMHGGDVALENVESGGARVTVIFPPGVAAETAIADAA